MQQTILVVDDEESIRTNFQAFLTEEGHHVLTAETYEEAVKTIAGTALDAVVADIILKGRSGLEILHETKRLNPLCPVIMITGAPDIETSTAAVRKGAFDYLIKPVRRAALVKVVQQALERKALLEQNERYRRNLEAILRSLSDAILTINSACLVTEANQAVAEICGFQPDALVGKHIDALSFHCNRSCMTALKRVLESGQRVDALQLFCRHTERAAQTVVINASSLLDRQYRPLGAIMAIRDVTRLTFLERELRERYQFENIIGKSPLMQKVYRLVEELSDVDTTVLITGESGTGKELIGKAIHYSGIRRDQPLVTVNCSALSENLLESELFGHVKGAFTGAVTGRVGRFQMADKGTILLDEIGDVPPRIQQRLLRVLQEKEFERVGESRSVKVDVRILSATNTDLRQRVADGMFREDLYYRLKVIEINLPPLRERREDIPLLTAHIVRRLSKKLKKEIHEVSDAAIEVLMNYTWPGNVRELENALEHAFILCHEAIIRKHHLPFEIRENMASIASQLRLKSSDERETILRILIQTGWNKAKAARILGVSRPTLYSKIAAYRLQQLL